MPFHKGQSGNPSGRTKGVSNKNTSNIKDAFQKLLENNLDKLQEDLDELKSLDRLKMMESLASYFLPKLRNTNIDANIQSNDVQQELIQKIYEMNDSDIDKLCEDD